jgi:hypothetical protein
MERALCLNYLFKSLPQLLDVVWPHIRGGWTGTAQSSFDQFYEVRIVLSPRQEARGERGGYWPDQHLSPLSPGSPRSHTTMAWGTALSQKHSSLLGCVNSISIQSPTLELTRTLVPFLIIWSDEKETN